MQGPFADLVDLTDALYQAELAKMHGLAAQESKLRSDLAKLDLHHKQNMALSASEFFAPRHIGADVLWQGWVGRSRAELNRQLALVLAHKAQMMKALHHAHGKRHAASQLLENAQSERRKKINEKRDQQEQNLLLLKPYQG